MFSRRLSDATIAAHRIACDEQKKMIARLLMEALELELTQIGGDMQDHREATEKMEAAFDAHEKAFGSIKDG